MSEDCSLANGPQLRVRHPIRSFMYTPIGGDDSSPDDESTLKCGVTWSGSVSNQSNSTSDLTSSSEDEDKPPREDLTSTVCDEDFQWIRSSPGMEKTKPPSGKLESSPGPALEPVKDFHRTHSSDEQNNAENCEIIIEEEKVLQTTCVIDDEAMLNSSYESYQTSSDNLYNGLSHKPPKGDSGGTNVLKQLPPAGNFDKSGSLDRRRNHQNGNSRASRDQKARSSIVLHSPRFRSPSRPTSDHHHSPSPCYSDATYNKPHYDAACCGQRGHCAQYEAPRCSCSHNVEEAGSSEQLLQRHERRDPHRYGSSSRLCRGSQPDLTDSWSDLGHCCCAGHLPPPPPTCCHYSVDQQRCRWRHAYKPSGEVEERLRRLEADKESLQLQVQVLSEQIEAQTDKITDLEKMLDEKKKQLGSTENLLQREMLSRSSLETQKLELMSTISELKLQHASLERDNLELRERLGEERRRNKPPAGPRANLMQTSTPNNNQISLQLLGGASPSPSPVSSVSDGSPRRLGQHPHSLEDFKDIPPPRTPPANFRRKVEHYGSLPRQRPSNGCVVLALPTDGSTGVPVGPRKGVMFGKGFPSFLQQTRRVAADKSFSSPNLAETERVVIEDHAVIPADEEEDEEQVNSSMSPQQSPSLHISKNKGIKKILGRIKRSGSGNLDDLPGEGEFRRGGVRATAGARLGWSTQVNKPGPDLPFVDWDGDAICQWLQELGLECYLADAKRWVKSGAQMLAASSHDLDKELGIKNMLHRKKLQLALMSQQENMAALDPHLTPAGVLDTAWVLRWLDDAGLPQHKETFLAARVDGRVLHRLTMDDLATLHVTSHLHVASLRRGIQVLRDHSFEANCLQRRSLPDDPAHPSAEEVALWTNHRVMEWLRVVDLAEYAPNLRGSGVHGGLMVHESRFTAELLATLLSIPPSKTLLRRHLNTHFKELLGRDCIQEKREAETTLGYIPLTATTKVKIVKKSQFTLKRKKSKSELDFGDLVCPLDPSKTDDTDHHPKTRGCLSGH